ncbi:MAG: hypothetical protein KF768_02100 [Phycisphaeraceae bacterium]|nr:hypothetical protein [Phycisphaeraceae bacterium]
MWERLERLFGSDDLSVRAEFMRRLHSRWLTRAMRVGFVAPRIPTRRVDEGGFDPVMRTAEGRAWAAEWWDRALSPAERDA